MTETPIGDYALLGDTRTAALSGPDGSIDWLCFPRFDSRPVFGKLIGGDHAGAFAVAPTARWESVRRRYRPHAATVDTTWAVDGARVTLTEGLVSDVAGTPLPPFVLVRRLQVTGPPVEVTIRFDPRFGWDRRPPRARRVGGSVVTSHGSDALCLQTSAGLIEPGKPASMTVTADRPVTLVLTGTSRAPVTFLDPHDGWDALQQDERAWQVWCADLEPDSPFADVVVRSLLTLRLLTYSPSGAPVAAPTTSLPEGLGGGRNWDYRFAWPRDASIGIGAFLGAGRPEEAKRFLAWLLHASRLDRPRLPPMLTLFGKPVPAEAELDEWPGYRSSRPVRIGNAAASQHQLDVYGWPVDAAALLFEQGHRVAGSTWRALSAFADYAANHAGEPDAGIWEVRDTPQHFVHSKLMAWLALDRALRLAAAHRTPRRRIARWTRQRDALADAIRHNGYNDRLGSYARAFGTDELDAALLLFPVIGFEPERSPRVAGTIDAVARNLRHGVGVFRYTPGSDGIAGGEGAFLPCSFWLVQALARVGRIDDASQLMDDLVALGGPLGLFAEEVDTRTREALGNYPQALTHAAAVQAALALNEASTRATAQPRTRDGRPV